MAMQITYRVHTGLYVNLTNRCNLNCTFCLRGKGDTVGDSGTLWLEREPSKEEALTEILERLPDGFTELVFCGYGEPTFRLYDLLWICGEVKRLFPTLPIRVNTNGLASLINGVDAAPLFRCKVDLLSISLNAPDAKSYSRLCHADNGELYYTAMITFVRRVTDFVPHVTLTVVDGTISNEDKTRCAEIAREIGVGFKVRTQV